MRSTKTETAGALWGSNRPHIHAPSQAQRKDNCNSPGRSTPANLDVLLSRLNSVRKCGSGWVAKCPAHDDRNPSLSIGESDGGVVLLKCHAGCSACEVVNALGLEMSDLFPASSSGPGIDRNHLRLRMREAELCASANVLGLESKVVQLCAHDACSGVAISDEDLARLNVACARIDLARALIGGAK